jgi:cysteine desulfurase/selenocysteine lyase
MSGGSVTGLLPALDEIAESHRGPGGALDPALVQAAANALFQGGPDGHPPASPEAAYKAAQDAPKPKIPEKISKATKDIPRPKPPAAPPGETTLQSPPLARAGEIANAVTADALGREPFVAGLLDHFEGPKHAGPSAAPTPAAQSAPAAPALPASTAPPTHVPAGFASDPLAHVSFAPGLFEREYRTPYQPQTMPVATSMPTNIPAVGLQAPPDNPTSAPPAVPGLFHLGGFDNDLTGQADPLRPENFAAIANALFRGPTGGLGAETAMPATGAHVLPAGSAVVPVSPAPPAAATDVLHPDIFGAIANALFHGTSHGVPVEIPSAPAATAAIPATPTTTSRTPAIATPATRLDIESARDDFPILHQKVHGKPLVWLDNAATTQKPRQVVERIARFYYEDNSNVHRGAHTLAARATDAYEEARDKVAKFLGAGSSKEIVFVRGTTEAINLVAASFGHLAIGADDEIILSELEHHSNIVPWQLLAQRTGARLRVAKVDDNGDLRMDEYSALLNRRTRLVAMTQVSNAIGTVVPVAEVTRMAHQAGARVLIDGAQSVQHMPVNVQDIGCDFFVFSGHKIFGPSGVGALYGRRELLEEMPPWQGGGSMIENVTFAQSTYAPVPAKFEAGTPILAGAVGLGAALDYVDQVGLPIIERHESALMTRALEGLATLKRVRVIGQPRHRAGAISFVIDGIDVTTVGALLDQEGIAVRAGHHCAQPTLAHFGLKASVRPSFALYNNAADVDALIAVLDRIIHKTP